MRLHKFIASAVVAVSSYFHREWDMETLQNAHQISPFIRNHLKQVYLCLVFALASSAFGSYLHVTAYIGSSVAVIGGFLSIIGLYFVAPWKEKRRVCLLIAGAFFGGALLASWFTWFLNVDQGFVVTSQLAISLGFGCFWSTSKLANRFEHVYFGALLLCSPLIMIWLLIASTIFGGDSALWKFQLYPAILWFMVYVAAYSQEMVLKARGGDVNYVKHSVTLFTDFPAVVFHLCRIMCRRRTM